MPNLCPSDSQDHEPCAIGQGKGWIGLLQGAGLPAIAQSATACGIGGLLARTDMGQWIAGSAFATALYHSDGNGNVTCLMYPNGTLAEKYLYDPFGNMLSQYGNLASANRYRFSSKEWDSNSGLYYYLYRFYDPNLQRWVNRDPIDELGFRLLTLPSLDNWYDQGNSYRFVDNNPNVGIDAQGLTIYVYSRKTDWGVGNHSYFYDNSPPPGGCHSCGTSGSSGGGWSGSSGSSSGSSSSCKIPNPCPDGNEGGPNDPKSHCIPIPGGGESIMDCCKQNANNGIYCPGLHDCHTSLNNCLKKNGLKPPHNPRFGPPSVGPVSPQ